MLSGSLLEEPAAGGPQAVPPSPYGASRWAASAYGRMFHALFDAPVVTLRPSFAYGPGQERTKLIPHVITSLLEGGSPQLSTGERLLDWVFADDVARAYVAAASHAGVEGLTLDIGSGVLTSVREIVEAIVESSGRHRPARVRRGAGAAARAGRSARRREAAERSAGARPPAWRRAPPHRRLVPRQKPGRPIRCFGKDRAVRSVQVGKSMPTIYLDPALTRKRRHRLYAGDLFAFSPGEARPSSPSWRRS